MASDTILELNTVIEPINQGMLLDKCRKCGCMQLALDATRQAFISNQSDDAKALLQRISELQEQMEPIAYDCIGCKVCWGAEATRQLEDLLGSFDLEYNTVTCTPKSPQTSCSCSGGECRPEWNLLPGEYIVGNPKGSVAVCTLASHDLPASVITGNTAIAIAGKCDTENIGIEKVVLNVIANQNIRWLVLCGKESDGHCAGDALLKLKEHGVDATMRVLQATSRRPVLKNLTMLDIANFRQQVEIINLIGCTVPDAIFTAVRECSVKPVEPLAIDKTRNHSPIHETIKARPPKRLELDPSGFFVVLLNRPSGLVVCEHYENNGKLTHTIEGKDAALVAATAVELGLVSRLDHAAYLGRELAKAEFALKAGGEFVQDAALGELSQEETCSGSNCSCH